jgi:hypothetical protein
MTVRRNIVLASVVIAVVLIIPLSHLAHWTTWFEVVLIAAVGGCGLFVAVRLPDEPARPQSAPPVSEITPDPPPIEYHRELLADVRLPSNRADYSFRFAATVIWTPVAVATNGNAAALKDLAINEVVRRACELTQQRDPGDRSLVSHELSRTLSGLRSDTSRQVHVMAESVQLALPEEDQRRLDALATMRKNEEVWEYERRFEQNKRNYLSTDVLRDPGSAVVWWLARNDDQLEKAVANIALLTQLSHAVNNTKAARNGEAPETANASPSGDDTSAHHRPANSAAQHFEEFVGSLGIPPNSDAHILFTDQVAKLVAMRGHQAVADEMTQRRDVPDGYSDPDGESDLHAAVEDEPPDT